VLLLTSAIVGAALVVCLAGLGVIAFYWFLTPGNAANDGVVVAQPVEAVPAGPPPIDLPPAPPPVWVDAPPDFGPPAVQPRPIGFLAEFPPAAPAARADELVCNGDFEQGLKGFRSAYRHSPGNIRDAFTFCLGRSPSQAHSDAAAFNDHTGGGGLMMLVNGGDAVNDVLWGQTVAVRRQTTYTFSLWVASWYQSAPAELEVRINGKALGRVVAPARCGEWKELKATWHSGADSQAAIEIFNFTRHISGNDFAIDDISLRGPRPDEGKGKD
jgi:hypothetical protein